MNTETRPVVFRVIAPIIRCVDRVLRRRQGIFEYDHDPRCVFRLSVHPFEQAHQWPDGTRTEEGEVVGELHLWNEHLGDLSPQARGGGLRTRFDHSMRSLARCIDSDPRLRSLPGFFAESWVSAGRNRGGGVARVMARWGFQIDDQSDKREFWDQLYVRLLARTFSPGMPRGAVRRVRIWISRDEVMRRYEQPVVPPRAATASRPPGAVRLTAGG